MLGRRVKMELRENPGLVVGLQSPVDHHFHVGAEVFERHVTCSGNIQVDRAAGDDSSVGARDEDRRLHGPVGAGAIARLDMMPVLGTGKCPVVEVGNGDESHFPRRDPAQARAARGQRWPAQERDEGGSSENLGHVAGVKEQWAAV